MQNKIELKAGVHGFGDGSHPTTAGVIAALEAIDPSLFTPRTACDIGCGSGILSFAIIKLLGCGVIAADISAPSIATFTENARHNHIPLLSASGITTLPAGHAIPLHADGFDHPTIQNVAPFDLIVMNILAEPLLRLATDAEKHLAAEGVLILSGILQWQEPQIREAYQGLGLELATRLTVGDWVTLVWQKSSN